MEMPDVGLPVFLRDEPTARWNWRFCCSDCCMITCDSISELVLRAEKKEVLYGEENLELKAPWTAQGCGVLSLCMHRAPSAFISDYFLQDSMCFTGGFASQSGIFRKCCPLQLNIYSQNSYTVEFANWLQPWSQAGNVQINDKIIIKVPFSRDSVLEIQALELWL